MSDKPEEVPLILALTGVGLIGGTYLWNANRIASQQKTSSKVTFTILTANDIYEMLPASNGIGGLAELSSLLHQERSTSEHSIVSINGDILAATSIATLVKGAHMVDVFNAMKVDYVVPGNHEFDYGPSELKNRIKESNFEWLAANLQEKDGSLFKGCIATRVLDVEGFKIGLFGICTHETIFLSYPGDTIFTDVIETSRKAVEQLKKDGADVIVAVTHQSLPEDQELAKKVSGINLIIGGHEHSPFTLFEGDTMIHKSGQNANFLGRIDLSMERSKPNSKVDVTFTWKMITNKGFPKDPHVANVIQKYMQQLEDLKKDLIAKTLTTLESKTEAVRAKEATFGNLLTDAVRELTGTEITIVQGGAIRGDSFYEAGTILTGLDLNRELPFANVISIYKIRGQDLSNALEEGIRNLPHRAGCFPQVSGLKMTVDPKKPPNYRIQKITVGDKDIDLDKFYTIASTTFIRNGGDGYASLTKGEALPHQLNGSLLSSALVEYLRKHKEVAPKLEDRIRML